VPTSSVPRDRRHAAIRSLLRRRRIRSQAELAEALAGSGCAVDQSTLCRDLRELGIAKVAGVYRVPSPRADEGAGGAAADPAAPGSQSVARFIAAALPAGPNLLVVRCATGTASAVGLAIDGEGWPEVVGTVAGDDTLFIATGSARDQRTVLARLEALGRAVESGSAARTAPREGGR
jgi:transcriptional regulator of arginine metabolism